MEYIRSLLPGAQQYTSSADLMLQALGDLVQKFSKSTAVGRNRFLCLFSGIQTVALEEEQFDHRLEQAWVMVEESECTNKGEKKCRLMESFKGPVLEIVVK